MILASHLLHRVISPILVRESLPIQVSPNIRCVESSVISAVIRTYNICIIAILIKEFLKFRTFEMNTIILALIIVECTVHIEVQPFVQLHIYTGIEGVFIVAIAFEILLGSLIHH